MASKSIPTYIYFIVNKRANTIKIGISIDPEKRLKGLQTSNSDKLKLVFHGRGDEELEFNLHYCFGKYRLQGEWFLLCDEIKDFVRKWANNNGRCPKLPMEVPQGLWGRSPKKPPYKPIKAPTYKNTEVKLCILCARRPVANGERCWECATRKPRSSATSFRKWKGKWKPKKKLTAVQKALKI